TVPGSYQLQICADGGKVEAEVDENNNCVTSSGKIDVAPNPDLVVTSITIAPTLPRTVVPGASLAITAVGTNNGLVQAKASTMKYLLVNTVSGAEKNLNGTQTIPIVQPGASVTVQKTVTVYSDTATGAYAVELCADSAKVVTEKVESNNCLDAD